MSNMMMNPYSCLNDKLEFDKQNKKMIKRKYL